MTVDERILAKLDQLASGLSDLRVAVARLEERVTAAAPPSKSKAAARDGGLTALGGAIGAAIVAAMGK